MGKTKSHNRVLGSAAKLIPRHSARDLFCKILAAFASNEDRNT
jgi:hypothetical protein